GDMDPKIERDLRATVYGWLAFTFEMCRQRLIESLDADFIADLCAHALMDSLARVPGIPAGLAEAVSPQQR
ncbi:TetR/AcrR family transcriptional regulator, partial [Mycobacterium sp. ITM-2017-0098]